MEKHQQRLATINQDIFVLASNAVKDKSVKSNARLSIVNLIAGGLD
jgi:hypothetical protein